MASTDIRKSVQPSPERLRAVRRAVLLTLALNLVVAVAKVAYGAMAHALAIRADGFHSLTDSANNLVGLIAVWFASRPPDRGHPYGHYKFEILAAGLVGLSLLAMAYDVAHSAFNRIFSPNATLPIVDAGAFVVLSITLAVNVAVARWERRQGERHGSAFLVSDAAHTRSDVLVTLGVIGATVLVRAGYPEIDLLAALGVSVFIAAAGVRVLWRNLRYLTDSALVDTRAIESLALEVPGVASAHKIRTRGTPMCVYVDLHIQIARQLTVVDAHRVTHWVIDAIKSGLPEVVDVMVHTEPAAPGAPHRPLPTALVGDKAH